MIKLNISNMGANMAEQYGILQGIINSSGGCVCYYGEGEDARTLKFLKTKAGLKVSKWRTPYADTNTKPDQKFLFLA